MAVPFVVVEGVRAAGTFTDREGGEPGTATAGYRRGVERAVPEAGNGPGSDPIPASHGV